MSRRSTPERIDEARRAATRNRLIGEGVTEPTADAWIAAWAAKAAEDGHELGSAYWLAGWDWIAAQRQRRVRPLPESERSSLAREEGFRRIRSPQRVSGRWIRFS